MWGFRDLKGAEKAPLPESNLSEPAAGIGLMEFCNIYKHRYQICQITNHGAMHYYFVI